MAGNDLRELPDEMGQLTSLRKLQLSGNRLKGLPESLCSIPNLEVPTYLDIHVIMPSGKDAHVFLVELHSACMGFHKICPTRSMHHHPAHSVKLCGCDRASG